jgi:hypothetical protein
MLFETLRVPHYITYQNSHFRSTAELTSLAAIAKAKAAGVYKGRPAF